ncbi:hypothetical protein [Patulibacter defluvii]|uniref:hypothetical protein n=1 Tax=Patulibacter defluvii TaxID=3095358 RepID=UPI002A75B77D|nr:hypothetical protein [Patulibacter sp. DM4]
MVATRERQWTATTVGAEQQRAARRTLRAQIEALERSLAIAHAERFPHDLSPILHSHQPGQAHCPRLLGLGGLERIRDDLVAAHAALDRQHDVIERNRALLEGMRAHPGRHRFRRLTSADLGQPGCEVYEVRPRLGVIGLLTGWWRVKVSSGCPLGRPRSGPTRRTRAASGSGAGAATCGST